MKNVLKASLMIMLALFIAGGMTSCKKKGCTDPAANNYDANAKKDDGSCTYDPGTSTTDLLAKKVTTAPTIDGTIDASWAACQTLTGTATVPDPGQDLFKGYVGTGNDFKIRAQYDANKIYMLIEWDDANESRDRQTWYFDPGTKKWMQESRYPTFDGGGNQTRKAFYEDKFSFLFNVNNSTANWATLSCYATCHTGLSPADGKARHYTNAPGERIDMWHWKYVRTNINKQSDDQYQDEAYPNGRHSDAKLSGGYTNNTQELIVTGGTDTVNVPKYFIPNKTDYSWITKAEIDNGTAKLITAVDANGILTYSGGTIDPNTDTDFQQAGAGSGPKGIPSIYTEVFTGSRGDITTVGVYTGTGWICELSRDLKTGDVSNEDVDFSSLGDFPFGFAIFDNAALAHGIKPNLTLKFEK